MGLNTVAIYVFWNDHEQEEGTFDFTTGNRDLGEFLKTAKEEGVWVVLRSGPYSCGEWDFGGIPTICCVTPISSCARWRIPATPRRWRDTFTHWSAWCVPICSPTAARS